jgi:signal transduction histidine kinase
VRLGLRAQLLLALVVVTLGAIVSVGAIAIWQTRAALAGDRIDRIPALAELAAALVDGAPDPNVAPMVARAVDAAELVVYDARGAATTPRGAPVLPSDTHGIPAALAGAPPHAEDRPGPADLVAYAPLRRGGLVRVSFAVDAQVDALLAGARASVLLLGALDALLLVLVGSWMLRGTVVRPVRALEQAAGRVAAGELDTKVLVRGPGELGRLADAFDQMTASLRTGRESLIRSEKLAGIGRLAAGVAHEVGNPLAAILGYVETLYGETAEQPIEPEVRRDVLGRVRVQTERIHEIIQELLEYARPADDVVEPVDVAKVVAGAVSLVRAQARMRRVTTEVDVAAELPPVRASAGRLTQVLVNLLLNAGDAVGGSGRVGVDARVAAGQVVIGVSDDGPGIPADVRPRLFEPFFTTKDVGKGSGLGLSVSLAIVERWGGTIRVTEPGGPAGLGPTGGEAKRSPQMTGSRFEVYLPAATANNVT